MAPDENIAMQDEHQVFWRSSLAKNKVSVLTKSFRSVGREPGELLFGQALQILDRAQRCNDICDGSRLVRAFHFRLHLLRHWVAWEVHDRPLVNIHEIHRTEPLARYYGYTGCGETIVFEGYEFQPGRKFLHGRTRRLSRREPVSDGPRSKIRH